MPATFPAVTPAPVALFVVVAVAVVVVVVSVVDPAVVIGVSTRQTFYI